MNKNIKDWQEEERPREKMLLKGPSALSNAELVAILLRSGSRDSTAVDTARELLEQAGNSLGALSNMNCEKISAIKGIGSAKAATIMAASELGRRLASEKIGTAPSILSARDAAHIMAPYMKRLVHEELWVLFLNKACRLISKEMISRGGISSTVVDIRIIVRKCVEKTASSIIMVHNHPSGSARPGETDRIQTKAVKDALSVLDIALADHIIIAGDNFYSFYEDRMH